jgi:hypothetical protein
MKLNKLTLLGFALATLLFTNCTKSEDEAIIETEAKFDLGSTVSRAFKGTIVDNNNNPLSNVTVRLNGKVATTDSNGVFTFSNVSVLERFAFVTAEKTGFINGSRTLSTHEGLNSLEIMMLPETVVATIASGTVKDVTLPNNVKVTFDGAFMKADGSAYNGNVKVIMNHLAADDKDVFKKMPGNLLAINTQGEYKGLQTFGMINVELKGTNNEKLQLTSGHKANVVLPIAANQVQTAPSTIPMWHFDEVTGVWKEEGFSTKVGNVYKGEVAHFTWWNNDYAYTVGTLNVTVTSGGSPVNGVRCTVTRLAGSTGDVIMNLGTTNANGKLSSPVPLNEAYVFRAYANGVLIYEQSIPAANLMVRNIVIEMGVDQRPAGN